MPEVRCSVDGCNARLQPVEKLDPRDRDTWVYPECDVCFRPVCARHVSALGEQMVCDRCRREIEERAAQPELLSLGLRLPGQPSPPASAPE